MEDGRDIKKEYESKERLSRKEHCVCIFYEATQELVGGMLHRHVVQIRGC